MKVYPSKVDWWIAVLLIGIPLTAIIMGSFLTRVSLYAGVIEIIIGIGIGIFIATLCIPCRYIIADDTVEIRCGFIKQHIPINEITDIRMTSNPISAPALSLRRIEIVHQKGTAIISPSDREDFIAEIQRKKIHG